MNTNRLALVCLVLVGLGALTLAGCGSSKVSKSNLDKITNGMTLAKVEGILGKGTEATGASGTLGDLAGSAKSVTWKDGDKTITVNFLNDKVVLKTSTGL